MARKRDVEGYIFMSKHIKTGSTVTIVTGSAIATIDRQLLNSIFDKQLSAYENDASTDSRGALVGPTGIERKTNTIRKVHIADHLLASAT